MEKGTDWLRLWHDLVQAQSNPEEDLPSKTNPQAASPKAHLPHTSINRHWAKRDSNRDFVVHQVDAFPGATVLDIGAGTGSWAILLSGHARRVTAVESSPVMVQRLHENLVAEQVTNIDVVSGSWPDVAVEPHDFSLCSHGLYASADLRAFIDRMVQATRRTCFLVMRAPTPDGIMAEAAMRIWGHPYDSPNFQVGYNALLEMGIFPNVQMADSGLWSPWTNASLEEALAEVKRRFGLGANREHDDFLRDLLHRRLALVDGQFVWPRSVRSALIYWDTNQ